ncbi:MAG: DUF2163 domain-containing protein [Pseudomonadota bacterium]
MPRTIPAGLRTHLDGNALTLARLYTITPQIGAVVRLTDHDADLTVDSQLYVAGAGFDASALETKGDMSLDNMDLKGLLDTGIARSDIEAGTYDNATIEVRLVNWASPADGTVILHYGFIGEQVTTIEGAVTLEVVGLSELLSEPIVPQHTPERFRYVPGNDYLMKSPGRAR